MTQYLKKTMVSQADRINIEACHPIIFTGGDDQLVDLYTQWLENLDADLRSGSAPDQVIPDMIARLFQDVPFDICWFEKLSGQHLKIINLVDAKSPIFVKGLYVNLGTGFNMASILVFGDDGVNPYPIGINLLETYNQMTRLGYGEAAIDLVFSFGYWIWYFNHKANIYQSEEVTRHRAKENGSVIKRKSRPIIYVTGRKQKTVTTLSGRTLEYSHRFEVRGHWRTIEANRLGKDRNGNYNQAGRTWVRAFVKGPETAPPIRKTYVVPVGAKAVSQ